MRPIALLLLISACGREAASATPGQAPSVERGPAAAPSGEDTSGVQVRGRVRPSGEVELRVEQRGDGVVGLSPTVTVEFRAGGSFAPLVGTSMTLRPTCVSDAPRCIELGLGGTLAPPVWSGRTGTGQCASASEGRAVEPGSYRFVLTTCDGIRIEGEPFEVGH